MLALFELCGKIDRFDVGDARNSSTDSYWNGGTGVVTISRDGSIRFVALGFTSVRSFLAMLLTVGTMRADYRKFGRTGPSDKLVWSRGCPREARRLPAWTTWIARTVRQGSKL